MIGSRHSLYHICGIRLATETQLANWLRPAVGTPDLTFQQATGGVPSSISVHRRNPRYESPALNADGNPVVRLYLLPDAVLFEFPGVGDFLLTGDEILLYPTIGVCWEQIEIHFLNLVLPYWLERRGLLALHASAVAHEGRAIAFLGLPGAGKSTLAAGLAQRGLPLISDDLLSIEISQPPRVRPSMPTLRLSEAVAAHLLGDVRGLKAVLPGASKYILPVGPNSYGSFCEEAQPLHRIYLPHRRSPGDSDREIRIEQLATTKAVISMIRHSSLPRIPTALGLHGQRLDRLTQLVPSVSFRILSYPHGLDTLSAVCDALVEDR